MSSVLKKEKYRKAIDKKCNYKAWFGFLKAMLFPLLKLLLPARALGRENIPEKGGYILAFNHRSLLDAPMAFSAIPGYWHFIAKEELYNSAIMRWLLPRLGVVAVNRTDIDLSTIRKSVNILKNGEVIGIFPEGTRNLADEEDTMLEMKNGAAMFAVRGKVPVLPVYIYRKTKFFRRSYLYIGKPIDVSSLVSGPLTKDKLDLCASAISEGMEEARGYLNTVMREKRYGKEIRAEKKRMKTRRKAEKADAKRRKAEEKLLKKREKSTRKKVPPEDREN